MSVVKQTKDAPVSGVVRYAEAVVHEQVAIALIRPIIDPERFSGLLRCICYELEHIQVPAIAFPSLMEWLLASHSCRSGWPQGHAPKHTTRLGFLGTSFPLPLTSNPTVSSARVPPSSCLLSLPPSALG